MPNEYLPAAPTVEHVPAAAVAATVIKLVDERARSDDDPLRAGESGKTDIVYRHAYRRAHTHAGSACATAALIIS